MTRREKEEVSWDVRGVLSHETQLARDNCTIKLCTEVGLKLTLYFFFAYGIGGGIILKLSSLN